MKQIKEALETAGIIQKGNSNDLTISPGNIVSVLSSDEFVVLNCTVPGSIYYGVKYEAVKNFSNNSNKPFAGAIYRISHTSIVNIVNSIDDTLLLKLKKDCAVNIGVDPFYTNIELEYDDPIICSALKHIEQIQDNIIAIQSYNRLRDTASWLLSDELNTLPLTDRRIINDAVKSILYNMQMSRIDNLSKMMYNSYEEVGVEPPTPILEDSTNSNTKSGNIAVDENNNVVVEVVDSTKPKKHTRHNKKPLTDELINSVIELKKAKKGVIPISKTLQIPVSQVKDIIDNHMQS